MKKIFSLFAVIVILLIGVFISKYFLTHKVKPEQKELSYKGPLVKGIKIIKKDFRVKLIETGTVEPYRKFLVVPQVSGKIVYISPNFFIGKIIKKGEPILKIEKIDYEVAYFRALKQLKDAVLNYERILEEAKISKNEIKSAKKEFKIYKPSRLKLYIPQIESAKASVKYAQKTLELAKINLNRTIIKAPFDGFVLSKNCDYGEFLPTGKTVGAIIDISKVYVVVPLPDYELPFIDFNNKEVNLNINLSGNIYKFKGILLRTSNIISKTTGTIDLIIEVRNPYRVLKDNIKLFVGAFVEVEIFGKLLKNVAKIPSFAIHNGNEIWIYKNGRLYVEKTKIIKRTKDYVYISEKINNGDIIITTHLPYVSNGMKVRLK